MDIVIEDTGSHDGEGGEVVALLPVGCSDGRWCSGIVGVNAIGRKGVLACSFAVSFCCCRRGRGRSSVRQASDRLRARMEHHLWGMCVCVCVLWVGVLLVRRIILVFKKEREKGRVISVMRVKFGGKGAKGKVGKAE